MENWRRYDIFWGDAPTPEEKLSIIGGKRPPQRGFCVDPLQLDRLLRSLLHTGVETL